MNLGQNQKPVLDQSLSFDDVSKLFSLPLSEAADILGVSASALKKLCNENGLERWPHRKYLAGKSIEEIKKEAAKEKGRVLADRQKSPSMSHVKDKSPKSSSDISKLQSNTPHPGSKVMNAWRSHRMLTSSLAVESSTSLDEFKFGFPSNGLSKSTNKWWGSDSDDQDNVSKDDLKSGSVVNYNSEAQVNDTPVLECMEKGDRITEEDSNADMQDGVSLCSIRKRAVDEGKKALKNGILKKYRVDKLGEQEKILLRHLFQTS